MKTMWNIFWNLCSIFHLYLLCIISEFIAFIKERKPICSFIYASYHTNFHQNKQKPVSGAFPFLSLVYAELCSEVWTLKIFGCFCNLWLTCVSRKWVYQLLIIISLVKEACELHTKCLILGCNALIQRYSVEKDSFKFKNSQR